MMEGITAATRAFINAHRHDDVNVLALRANHYPGVDWNVALSQIAGWQIAERKVPSWAEIEAIVYPPHLSMEQCSSELTARYKAGLATGKTFVDLTGGWGVDCAFMSKAFKEAHYVERQEQLCRIAQTNFAALQLPQISVHHADATDYLKAMRPVDCIFIDPARRNDKGAKIVAITDCEPDVTELEELLVEKAEMAIIKLSPMLDISSALSSLKYASELHIVSVDNECKELLVLLRRERGEVTLHCADLCKNVRHLFSFTLREEMQAVCPLAAEPGSYLYEPNVAVLKAGAFRRIAEAFGLEKLAVSSHLYTSDCLQTRFPGRVFRIVKSCKLDRREILNALNGKDKANITVRNFPVTVAEIRKKCKLRDGGDNYLFATTMANGKRVVLVCTKQLME